MKKLNGDEISRKKFSRRTFLRTMGTASAGLQVAPYISSSNIFAYGREDRASYLAKVGITNTDNYERTFIKQSEIQLLQNFPNPFNPATNISFTLPHSGNVVLKVYNSLGQEVATLVNGYKTAQHYNVDFNASNLSSGVHIYSIQFNNQIISKKMILMK